MPAEEPTPTFEGHLHSDKAVAENLGTVLTDYRGRPLGAGFLLRLVQVARRIGASPEHLAAILSHESGFAPHAQYGDVTGRAPFNPSLAQGILQFTPNTLKGLGVTPAQVRAMSATEQLGLVEQFFKDRARERLRGGPLDTLAKLAMATFYPAYMSKPLDTLFPTRVRDANPGIDTPRDYLTLVIERMKPGVVASGLSSRGLMSGALGLTTETPEALARALVPTTNTHYAQQVASAVLIVREFLAAGVPVDVIMAALANAYAESALDPNAVSERPVWGYKTAQEAAAYQPPEGKENSRGLFQLGPRKLLAGVPMSDLARHDPVKNTQWILQEYGGRWGKWLREAQERGATVEELAWLWARDIERPSWAKMYDKDTRALVNPTPTLLSLEAERRAKQASFLGPLADQSLGKAGVRQAVVETAKTVAKVGAGVGMGALVFLGLLAGAGYMAMKGRR